MEIREHRHGAILVLTPVGPLLEADAEQFRRRVRDAITETMGRFVINAESVPFVDSAGLEAILDAADLCADAGQVLRLSAVNDTVREVLELVGIAPLVELHEDAAHAARCHR